MKDEIQLEDFRLSILALWKKKLLVIAATILTLLIGLLITMGEKVVNTYVAEATIYSAAYGSYQESETGMVAMISYADIVSSKKVCESAAALIGNDINIDSSTIQGMIGVSQSSDAIIKVYAISTDSEIVVKVANAVAEAFVRQVTSITGFDSIQVLDNAQKSYINSNGASDLLTKRLLFAAIGLFASSGWIICSELLSNKIHTIVQCVDKDEDEILGIIPYQSE